MSTTAALAPLTATAPERGPRRERGVWAWLWFGISAGLLAVILGIGVAAIAVPRFAGAVPLTVLSASMEPSLPPGTMLIVRPLAQDQMNQVRIGDIISFQPSPQDPTLITHRVVGISHVTDGRTIFTTQGDANATVDAPVHDYQVRAVLWYSLPGLGWVSDAINGQGNRVWIIPTAAGLLFAYAAYTAISTTVTAVKKKRADHARGEENRGAA
ncbi:signal peptidase I [Gryllotalpicola protaetiae]|uniref:Signal peptidase I n=1 Tax=Gryllotalpicola protaetiae TaxID=2419771 RepID=A0A387BHJ8_9MICO|nr:signal peptidase I [Gryllotalpicola protaetiae]AYG03303.1 signal peptidase I [Gryllotalpicola protaetiae]